MSDRHEEMLRNVYSKAPLDKLKSEIAGIMYNLKEKPMSKPKQYLFRAEYSDYTFAVVRDYVAKDFTEAVKLAVAHEEKLEREGIEKCKANGTTPRYPHGPKLKSVTRREPLDQMP